MFKRRYALAPHRPKRLELRRSMDWSDVRIVLDGRELVRTNRDALHEGIDIALPDESLLRVWITNGPNNAPFLYLTRNGHPLPGSEGDPAHTIWLTVSVFWCLAVAQVFFAFLVIRYGNPDQTLYAIGAAGLVLGLLGILAWRRSYAAMVLASIVCFSELALLFWSAGHGAWDVWRPLFGLGLLGWLLLRAINAVRDLNAVRLPIRHPPELIRPLEHHPPPHATSE
jgi:hypothetical protein